MSRRDAIRAIRSALESAESSVLGCKRLGHDAAWWEGRVSGLRTALEFLEENEKRLTL